MIKTIRLEQTIKSRQEIAASFLDSKPLYGCRGTHVTRQSWWSGAFNQTSIKKSQKLANSY